MSVLLRQAQRLRGLRRDPRSTPMQTILPLRTVKTRVSSKFDVRTSCPAPRQLTLTTTRSPASTKSLIGSSACRHRHASRMRSHWRMQRLPTDDSLRLGPALRRCARCTSGSCRLSEPRPCLPRSTPRRRLARSPRSPATSPAQYPAGSGVGVSVLLRQPHGFEGFALRPGRTAIQRSCPSRIVTDARRRSLRPRRRVLAPNVDDRHDDLLAGVDELV